jgi:hypothetical protein
MRSEWITNGQQNERSIDCKEELCVITDTGRVTTKLITNNGIVLYENNEDETKSLNFPIYEGQMQIFYPYPEVNFKELENKNLKKFEEALKTLDLVCEK